MLLLSNPKKNTGTNGGLIELLELETARIAARYCGTCISLGDCPLPIKGYIPVPPSEEVKQMYAGTEAPWSWRKCHYLLTAEMHKLQEAAMAGKWQERELSTYKVTLGNKKAYETCREYASRLNPFVTDGILLWGPVGTGKTHLAIGVLKAAFRRGLIGVHIKVPDLLEEIRRGYDNGVYTLEERVKNTFLVVLDDLGAEKVTDWVREKLYSIIGYRYENQKPTIITTNYSPAELTERIGERITDRLREMCIVVKVEGKSWRARG